MKNPESNTTEHILKRGLTEPIGEKQAVPAVANACLQRACHAISTKMFCTFSSKV